MAHPIRKNLLNLRVVLCAGRPDMYAEASLWAWMGFRTFYFTFSLKNLLFRFFVISFGPIKRLNEKAVGNHLLRICEIFRNFAPLII